MKNLKIEVQNLIEQSEYNKAAELVVKELGIEMTVKFLKNDYHFAGDKDTRDIYKVTLKRGDRKYSFKFGQSLYHSQAGNKKEPTMYDILTCLTTQDPETFEDFCDNFGYNTDSRSAKKIYKAVVKEYDNICKLFSDKEIEVLNEIM